MKINQDLVTKTFQCRNGTSGLYHDPGDVKVIQEVLKRELGVTISESEVIDFWHWRSNEWDGSFLSIMGGEKEILEWFPKFLQHVGMEIDEEEEQKLKEYGIAYTSNGSPPPSGAIVSWHPAVWNNLSDALEGCENDGWRGYVCEYPSGYRPEKGWSLG